MITLSRFRRAAAVAAGAAALALTGLSAGAASAATPHAAAPRAATGCSGRICMHVTTPSGGLVTFNAWLYNSGDHFYGHYDLIDPLGRVYHRPTTGAITWTHDLNAYWLNMAATVGKWCVVGWQKNSNGTYSKISGEPCENVS